MIFRSKYSAKLDKRWIVSGQYRQLYCHMRFFSGLRGLAEHIAMQVLPTAPLASPPNDAGLNELQHHFGDIESALLYDTSAYKESYFIGVIRRRGGESYFVKSYKHAQTLEHDHERIFDQSGITALKGQRLSPTLHTFALIAGSMPDRSDKTLEQHILNVCAAQMSRIENDLCWAHGDCCRQNFIKTPSGYTLVDFECYGQYPAFFDWFHFQLKDSLYRLSAPILSLNELISPIMALGYDHADALGFLEQYLRAELRSAIRAKRRYDDPRLTIKQQRLMHFLKHVITPQILLIHQGHDLYGSGRIFINTIEMWQQRFPKARITVDLPEPGPLSEQLAAKFPTRFNCTWIARKYLFKQGLRTGLKGFVASLERARHDLNKFDTIYVNTITPITYFIEAIFHKNRPICHVHEIPSLAVRIAFSLIFAIARPHLVFNSKTTRKAYFVAPWLRHSVVLNSFDGTFDEKADDEHEVCNILAIGRINPQKGWLVFADALQQFSQNEQQRLRIRFVGDTYKDQHHMLDDLVTRLNGIKPDIVEFHPFCNDPTAHYQWADVVVVPSLVAESFGLVAVEAMAASCAVIASDSGALPELIPADAGIITETGNATALHGAIKYLAERPNLIRHMGKAGLRHSKSYRKSVFLRQLSSTTLKWSS